MNKIEKIQHVSTIGTRKIAEKINELIQAHNSEAEEVEMGKIREYYKRRDNTYYVCPKCDDINVLLNSNFCPNCGVKIKWNI